MKKGHLRACRKWPLVEAPGIEPGAAPTQAIPRQSLAASDPQPLAQTLARETEIDPDLARVVSAWPDLPEAIRAGIGAMVKAASGSQPDRGAKGIGCEEGEV